ncbi:type IV pilus modification protein PilV [Solemya pervernicosa gill symbiont]|uniref:Type IV pilus modification protein PilV n=2 Tax=Gammaproteobacteria incertae sedis TaxID=118884 RepID=A0A1T2L8F5_9GAMM|nr:type IV pilus modification protein PilV [Candidatus Reidiella endopervernicosa]OOZ41369.1 type IV pilus modification protein PilV [Solemya pervernicosa gill symbiont]QKQ27717.1 type IV pilus modification protein PilV [Candidatus Reidiella endopervernicosa]
MERRQQNGFAMMEVLVTVLVLSVGLLGIAAMQTTGLKYNHSAYLRTQATLLAYDISDRMRSNMSAVTANSYVTAYNDSGTAISNCSSASSGCSSVQMAQNDLFEWKGTLSSELPFGQGQITRVSGSNQWTISVMWDDERNNSDKIFTTVFQP